MFTILMAVGYGAAMYMLGRAHARRPPSAKRHIPE